jgi:hypothetical protein
MENLKSKFTGFRFVVFIITSLIMGGYFFMCNMDKELIQLQGIMVSFMGLSGILIGGKTYTDVKGKK